MTTEFNRDNKARTSEHDRVRVIREGVASYLPDIDPDETGEWLESFDDMVGRSGPARARYLMLRLLERAGEQRVAIPALTSTDYVNTIPTELEPWFPGDEELERRYRLWIRWNAAIMVHRAQRPGIGVGGHISTYASSASLYEVGFNHFFRGKAHPGGGDQIFIQGHASPGIYARAFLEGRLTEDRLDGFRQEHSHRGGGLPSYPHPRLMPDFWEFPTVSMGLGPMNAIYQARFNHYLHDRGIKDTSDQHVWAFLGDGEMDEPESRGLLQVAANEGLDNLTFVINCNLQRLDGPVRGNGKIIQELESFFRGAGWNVIKVVWGREWDALLHADKDGALVNLMNNTPDGDYQTLRANDGGFIRENWFNRDPRTKELAKNLSDADIWRLKRGGHDYRKVYAAYRAALDHHGQPTVILAKTIKGYTLGTHFEGRNATHQMKKLALDDLKAFRDTARVPITDAQLEADPYLPPYYHPGPDAPEIRYMLDRRRALGGFVPERRTKAKALEIPGTDIYASVLKGSGNQEVATTMATVRVFKELLRDKNIGWRIVPIIPDEARTFGMDSWFPTLKIYNRNGQTYRSVDSELMLAYRESEDGHILHEGINEAGSSASFIAVGTSYLIKDNVLITWEAWYKWLQNQVDFKDGAELFGNDNLENELSIGKGYAFSPLELEIEKKEGKLTGWIGYTLAWARRGNFPDINGGRNFPPRFDTRHNLSVVAFDAAGNSSSSSVVAVNVANASAVPATTADTIKPVVTIVSPSAGSTASGLVTIKATFSDNSGNPSLKHRLFINNVRLVNAYGNTLTYVWDSSKVAAGTYTFKAWAVDAANNQGVATVTVKKP